MIIASSADPRGPAPAQRLRKQTGAHVTPQFAEVALAQAVSDLDGSIHLDSLPQMAFELALARLDGDSGHLHGAHRFP